MSGAKILLDNAKEAAALNNIMHFQYDGSLLPIERRTAIINGKLSEGSTATANTFANKIINYGNRQR